MRLVPVSGPGLALLALLLLPAILTTNVSAAELKSSSPLTPQTIRQAQEALKNKGRDPGPIDGVLGPRTVAALNAYQKAEGLRRREGWTPRQWRASVSRCCLNPD